MIYGSKDYQYVLSVAKDEPEYHAVYGALICAEAKLIELQAEAALVERIGRSDIGKRVDHFAGLAMQAILMCEQPPGTDIPEDKLPGAVAIVARIQAEAMIKELDT